MKPPATLRALIALAWPMVLARATQSVVGFTDAWMVSPLGDGPLAATTTGALDSFAFIIFWTGTGQIIQSFAAQLMGQGRGEEARRYAWYGLAIAGAGAVIALTALPLLPALMGLVKTTPEVRGLMVDYLRIRLLSVGGAVGLEVLGAWYAGRGNTRMQLWASVVTMSSNVLFCWLFIRGHLGAPALGVRGSALAATLASWLGFALIAGAFALGRGGAGRPHGRLGLQKRELARVLRFGAPSGVNWFVEFAAFLVFVNVVAADLGTARLAALNVVIQINSVSFMPAFGIATAGAILAGQAIGRGDQDHVGAIVWLTLKVTGAWMAAVGFTYFVLAHSIVGLFGTLAAATFMLRLSAGWQLFDAVATVMGETLRAAGDTAWPMLARIGLAWVLFLPTGVLTVNLLGGGETAAMLCLIGYLALLAALLAVRYRTGAWRAIRLTGEPDLLPDPGREIAA